MAGWGGARPGAGAPTGGISQVRRLLVRAITRGLADAMRDTGEQGADEELAERACADIVRSMAHSGRGDDVLRLYAQMAPARGDSDTPDDGDTPLDRALKSMPGLDPVPDRSRAGTQQDGNAAGSTAYRQAPSDGQSEARPSTPPTPALGLPQFAMFAADGSALAAPAGAQPAARTGATPPQPYGVRADVLENSVPGALTPPRVRE